MGARRCAQGWTAPVAVLIVGVHRCCCHPQPPSLMADVAPPQSALPRTRSKPIPQQPTPSNPDAGLPPTVAYNPDAPRQPAPTTPSARRPDDPDVSPRHQTSTFPHCYVDDGNGGAVMRLRGLSVHHPFLGRRRFHMPLRHDLNPFLPRQWRGIVPPGSRCLSACQREERVPALGGGWPRSGRDLVRRRRWLTAGCGEELPVVSTTPYAQPPSTLDREAGRRSPRGPLPPRAALLPLPMLLLPLVLMSSPNFILSCTNNYVVI